MVHALTRVCVNVLRRCSRLPVGVLPPVAGTSTSAEEREPASEAFRWLLPASQGRGISDTAADAEAIMQKQQLQLHGPWPEEIGRRV